MLHRSLFGKIAVAHLAVIFAVFLTLFIAVSYLMEFYFHRSKERELISNASTLAVELAAFPDLADSPSALAVLRTFQQFTGTTAWIVAPDGVIIKTSAEADAWISEVVDALSPVEPDAEEVPVSHWTEEPETGRPQLAVVVPVGNEASMGVLYVLTPLVGVRTTIGGVRQLLISAGIISLVAAGIVGYLTSARIVAPLESMSRVVRAMTDGDLGGRVRVESDDEVGQLGAAFNTMASHLQATVRQLSQEKRKTEAVVRSMTDGVLFVDETGRVRMTNAAVGPVLNVHPDAAVGRPLAEVVGDEGLVATFRDVSRRDESVHDALVHDGRPYSVHIAPVGDEAENMWGAVGLFHDTSEQDRLEKMRREFVADVSHELRTPLTSIRGFLHAIADGVARDEQEAEEYLRIAIDETERLQRLAETLLDVSSMAAGGTPFQPERVDLAALMATAVEKLEPQARKRDIRIHIAPADRLPTVFADVDKVEQILLNLLDNALRHTAAGGKIDVSVRPENGFVWISVRDYGPGIAPDEQPLVWERFYKVDKSRQKGAGSGLGLVIVRHLVEMHGGTVSLESTPGAGAVFSFSLPTGRGEVPLSAGTAG